MGIFSNEAQTVLDTAMAARFRRQLIFYNFSLLADYEPNKTYLLDEKIRGKLHLLNELHLPPKEQFTKLYKQFVIDCTYTSSKLEGVNCSYEDIEKYVNKNGSPNLHAKKKNTIIFNHITALDSIISYDYMDYDIFTLKTLHGELSQGLIDKKTVGQIRETPIAIIGSNYRPLKETSKIKEQLELIFTKVKQIADLFEQSFFLLIFITYLQPFVNKNKNIARIIANIPLIKNKLYPLLYFIEDKNDYVKCILALYEINNILPFKELYMSMYENSVQRYLTIE